MMKLGKSIAAALCIFALLSGVSASAEYRPVIDPGHGGEDGGADVGSVMEKDLNLEIAERLRDLFYFLGIEPVMLRDSDLSLHDAGCRTIREKKVSDLKNRVSLINAVEDGFLISIHQNKFPESRYFGAQVFYPSDAESKALAEFLQESIRANLIDGNPRNAAKVSSSIYLMNHIKISGVLVECGFLSNQRELALLRTPEYQRKFAAVICQSFLMFRENTAPSSAGGMIRLSPD